MLKEKALITLSSEPDFRKSLKKLLRYNSDIEYIWDNFTKQDFLNAGLLEKEYEKFLLIKNKGFREKEYEIFLEEKMSVLFHQDKQFPQSLKEIADSPLFIFVKGDISLDNSISIIGSRRPSRYGETVTTIFSEKLASSGLAVVSGLALGIDSIAHRGALSGHGKTIAVLGSGVNTESVYPRTNFILSNKILDTGGALLSEYPPFYPIHKMNFPERNRIISGLSRGLLIAEAREKSGALITADFALEQGKDVFVIPHDIIRYESFGGNRLIKEGATPVTDYKDILDAWGIDSEPDFVKKGDLPNEQKVIDLLSSAPLHIDEIKQFLDLTPEETSATLSLMEIKGMVVNHGAQIFRLNK